MKGYELALSVDRSHQLHLPENARGLAHECMCFHCAVAYARGLLNSRPLQKFQKLGIGDRQESVL